MVDGLEVYKCPNCGANIDFLLSGTPKAICEYCGAKITIRQKPVENVSVNIVESVGELKVDNVIKRACRLLCLCEDRKAKELIEKALIYYPEEPKLLELENECNSFLSRSFLNYLKMLTYKTFLDSNLEGRYFNEINGFCNMLSDKADSDINIAVYRKQNIDNYNYILSYLKELKSALKNEVVVRSQRLYKCVINAVLKLTATVCNTIYKQKNIESHIKLITLQQRRSLVSDFNIISKEMSVDKYKIASEIEWERYK